MATIIERIDLGVAGNLMGVLVGLAAKVFSDAPRDCPYLGISVPLLWPILMTYFTLSHSSENPFLGGLNFVQKINHNQTVTQ